MTEYFAHTPSEADGRWHDLKEHLFSVAETARDFAEAFQGADIAYVCGLLHDLGKFHPEFQTYLKKQAAGEPAKKVPHAVWGAALLYQLLWKKIGFRQFEPLTLPIAGHHAGLSAAGLLTQTLEERLDKQRDDFVKVVKEAEPFYVEHVVPYLEKALKTLQTLPLSDTERELWIRLVFSALVDADYLDTERHFKPHVADVRRPRRTVQDLWQQLAQEQETFMKKADDTWVNRIRRQVYQGCVDAAVQPPGVFRLTVPTGGGKTRSGLAFALRHAVEHQLERVIVVIPYTSIIEQTAAVYRDIFGDEAVLEHHSQVEFADDESAEEHLLKQRLATENWDAPLIVTTTVQLFDSLFSNKPSQVRKLHRLSRSVILLDEVQTLPPELLRPTLDGLAMLVRHCQSTVVLSTATQPVFEESRFLEAFADLEVKEILPPAKVEEHFQKMRRVDYEIWPEPLSGDDLVDVICKEHQILVVFNTRKEARECVRRLKAKGEGNVFHLSTLLCGAHRRNILAEVRARLAEGRPVRLISTQVVEAGVDLDFPLVMRQIGPLDRIVQAAGRCNREGRLERGRVIIFATIDGGSPRGPYRVAMETAKAMMASMDAEDLHHPDIFRTYFTRLFASVDVDQKNIQSARKALDYPTVAEKYRMIDQDTVPVVVRYENSRELLQVWEKEPSRQNFRRLQPYIVQLFAWEAQKKEQEGWLRLVSENLYEWLGGYDELEGLTEDLYDPYDLIV